MTRAPQPSLPGLAAPEAHHCHARGCATPVPPEMLCCRRHWAMVPKPLQREVWRHYRGGQCDDKSPSPAWHAAAAAALAAVAAAEGRSR